ncbi:DEAD/DEAH box helicase family protein [bacterium]|nr:DEAD/DEAH box helicase family protein [bacterium]MBU1993688.1 DEAD/DEAH box helicase family protein [bacterium]
MTNLIEVNYSQTGKSKTTNALGMRAMQERAYEKRNEQYLLLKAPPASGKSRALMFIALDKLLHQNIKKVIVAVPEKSIGGSFGNADLMSHGFECDWHVEAKYNLCTIESNESRSAIFKEFLTNDAKILICTHSTLRNAFETINESRFDNTLLAIDEFHHLSASDASVLGNVLKSIIAKSNAHIMAMTGSYFRGDAHPILLPEVEDKFAKVSYNYYEQLNGYEHLKSLGIGYHFYQGKFTEAISEVLDLSKKTIIHIPHVNSRESTKDKHGEVGFILDVIGELVGEERETGVISVKRADGKILKVADLVNDDPVDRPKIQKYLREIKSAEDMDIIIALGMAKEGFDWPYCEHALTVGYRASLTEIIQIIGRATRDSQNKSHAQFTNLIAQPDATSASVANATNDMLKAITASLLMEQVLAPNFKFKTKLPHDESEHVSGEFKINGYKEPSSKRVKDIVEQDLAELKAKILQDATIEKTLGSDITPEVLNKMLIPKIIQESYPELSADELEEVRQHVVVDSVFAGAKVEGNRVFIQGSNRFINIDELSIDLIDSINPFQRAYEIMSKKVDEKILKLIQESIDATKLTVNEAEAAYYWKDVNKFYKEHGKEPSKNSNDEFERKLADVLLFVKAFKRKNQK